jgi:hypothetical protein
MARPSYTQFVSSLSDVKPYECERGMGLSWSTLNPTARIKARNKIVSSLFIWMIPKISQIFPAPRIISHVIPIVQPFYPPWYLHQTTIPHNRTVKSLFGTLKGSFPQTACWFINPNYIVIWRLPKIWVPLNHPLYFRIFHYKPSSY